MYGYYIFNTATGTFTGFSAAEIGVTFDALTSNHQQLFLWADVNFALILLVVRQKLADGIEKNAKILLPGLAIIKDTR
jgi:SNF family Na+-dependent transporter